MQRLQPLQDLFAVDDHYGWHPHHEPPSETDEDDESMQEEENKSFGDSEDQGEHNQSGGQTGSDDENQEDVQQIQEMWQEIAEEIQMDLETFSRKHGSSSDSLMQNLMEINRERYDYAEFLRKFSSLGEAMKINDDEFDYIFYTYGLKLYGKMPLIEPLEYKEVKRVKEFAIAIDTSQSVNGELVQKFVEKTYNILEQQENFFTTINLHIIQCDTEIQEAVKVTNRNEFDEYLRNMTLKGFGGTDFRPVFGYIEEMIRNKEFTNFKGLIYFTDGYGEFPKRQPDFRSAFVFIDDEYNNPNVPVWAIKLVLQSDDI